MRAAAEAGITLQIGYWRRFVPELVELRERIARRRPRRAVARLVLAVGRAAALGRLPARSGGILVDMGVHEFDQIRWLTGQELGELAAVASSVTAGAPVPGDPESVQAQARLSGGAVATRLARSDASRAGDCCWVELMGTAGHERCVFMSGPDGERVFLDALAAQARGVRGRPCCTAASSAGATGADAVRAIGAAERAAAALAGEE